MGQKVLFSSLYEGSKSLTAQKNKKFSQTFETTGRDATNLAVSVNIIPEQLVYYF